MYFMPNTNKGNAWLAANGKCNKEFIFIQTSNEANQKKTQNIMQCYIIEGESKLR